ncbi:tRNA (adenosine(37)-N6)-threonylcarbamoyltransferase complex ATPase subunit type 1 TsaE [Cohnella lubricantis]|uniref:tRNA threonylcarbamoyladenosine biosynthesis protein TsaE n=1 Tax=Cohnella lubricantis TaxID=2163172 RepID=A0A841TKN3_9BACL|nr:tRNA (adenosine(37)-N6)-threonylcarbamoyltransferase complex ATPase subunit type 1 TsaE [Cohnella lubricantis]MBB6679750.1 tRNA (adenosine(37)-N6)-threonylcarbamoyltransferase complex ATPase subunit type 1 TsaE [Cohnella lubricantis]MBP2119458.1 tRNA threonylcarbamoyladenosine biosynthesis protein TsaE [Cohnella lubricantis]
MSNSDCASLGRSFVWEARTEEDTASFAKRLSELAVPGTVLALDGDLGAGKTRFAQAFAAGLGVPGHVNSPTFTIIKEYEGGRLPFYHMDVYRLSMAEADELGLDEYFAGSGVTLVEWASLIEPLLPEERLHLRLTTTGPTSRRLEGRALGERYAVWCTELGMTEREEEGA